jgi:antitoxin CptB
MDDCLDAAGLNRLRWRCRRGLLENDLFIERFFRDHGHALTPARVAGLMALMDLSDNDLLDLLLARKQPQDELDLPEVHEVLARLRQAPAGAWTQTFRPTTEERPLR